MTAPAPTTHNVLSDLGGLTGTAPQHLLPAVLVALGLADQYATVPGPTGELFVAWNVNGVSAVAPVDDQAKFEETFAARVGRRLVVAAELPSCPRGSSGASCESLPPASSVLSLLISPR